MVRVPRAPGERRRLSNADLDRALAIREGLRALAFCNNGHALDAGAVDELREASKGIATEVRLGPEGPDFVPVDAAGADPALSVLLASAAEAMIDGGWERLKACPGRDCGWVFFDQSRNGSARWCSMKVCGDREKSRATGGGPARHDHPATGRPAPAHRSRRARRRPAPTRRRGAGVPAAPRRRR